MLLAKAKAFHSTWEHWWISIMRPARVTRTTGISSCFCCCCCCFRPVCSNLLSTFTGPFLKLRLCEVDAPPAVQPGTFSGWKKKADHWCLRTLGLGWWDAIGQAASASCCKEPWTYRRETCLLVIFVFPTDWLPKDHIGPSFGMGFWMRRSWQGRDPICNIGLFGGHTRHWSDRFEPFCHIPWHSVQNPQANALKPYLPHRTVKKR